MISLFKSVLEARKRRRLANQFQVGSGSRFHFLNVHIKERCFLSIGQNSIVEGKIFFDKEGCKVSIGDRTFVGASQIVCAEEVVIGDDVLIAWGCNIVDHNSHSVEWEKRKNDVTDWMRGAKDWEQVGKERVVIGNRSWIGFNSIILKGVVVGEGSVVAAGSVVTKDVPPFTVVAGNPARVIKELGVT